MGSTIFMIIENGMSRIYGSCTRRSAGLSVHSWVSVVVHRPVFASSWFWNRKTRLTMAVLPITWMDSSMAWLRSVLISSECVACATAWRRWSFLFSFSWAIIWSVILREVQISLTSSASSTIGLMMLSSQI